jgi:ribulose-5-phosphate 4-epimerase/fuculose-1-phosphate aldolase
MKSNVFDFHARKLHVARICHTHDVARTATPTANFITAITNYYDFIIKCVTCFYEESLLKFGEKSVSKLFKSVPDFAIRVKIPNWL